MQLPTTSSTGSGLAVPYGGLKNYQYHGPIWLFRKIRGLFLGILIIRIIVYWGLY